MKFIDCVLLTAGLLINSSLIAQSGNVGIGTTLPNASAILDVKSFTKGMLLPRTSTTSRLAIVNPAKGLILYDTTTSGFWFHNGSAWMPFLPGSSSWNLTGNAGTNAATSFIGSTDSKPLRFRVNNKWAGEIHPATGNIFLGLGAGNISTTGGSNVAIGEQALALNTEGSFIAACGYFSLAANTTGYSNTALGTYSLTNNTTGFSNTGMGRNALFANKTGSKNTASGEGALLTNTTGSNNTANGYQSLYSNTASNNSASGYQALYFNTTGSANNAVGYQSLYHNTAGEENTAAGTSALLSNTTGSSNTAAGAFSLSQNINGADNTAVGGLALFSNIGGSGNTAIGYFAGVAEGNLSNATAIGYNAVVNASNKVRIGSATVTVIEGQVPYSYPSDGRFKYNIKSNVPGLDFIKKLKPVTYYFDEQKFNEYSRTGIAGNNKITVAAYTGKQLHTGFIAQEVERIANESGYDFDGVHAPANDKDHYSLAYSQFIMPVVKAIQEQEVIIEELQREIAEMKKEMELLKKKN